VRRKLVETRAAAQRAIDDGLVRVGANPSPKASTLVSPDDPVHITEGDAAYVSRGGLKLAAALDTYPIDVVGVRAVDVGASTGGFTDCLLQHGAASVVAIDVGYGQMHWRIRQDERVEVVEKTNIRTADPARFGGPFDIVVADLSFISLRTVTGPLTALGADHASWILLIKPQFEAGRKDVGKGGIVRDHHVRLRTIAEVAAAYAECGVHIHGLMRSPISGASGNIEYVAWFTRDEGTSTIAELVAGLESQDP
jgi:23S rRNA (cytidine1920-2'-O)/16S rRNA (cytidine1409-2'-O)-methyltransferase